MWLSVSIMLTWHLLLVFPWQEPEHMGALFINIHCIMWDKITNPFLNVNGATIEV